MYAQIYDILAVNIYGSTEGLTAFQDLCCTQVSTFMCLVCVLLPFFACLWFCKVIFK